MAFLRLPDGEYPVDAVGFDVDGVLRDTGYLAFQNCRAAIAELGGVPPEFQAFVHDWQGTLIEYYRRCGVTRSEEDIRAVNDRYLLTHDVVAPFGDVAGTLEYLESLQVKMFALSGHNTEKVQAWFEEHGLHVRFAHVQGDGRDKMSHLSALCRQLRVSPGRACYIGDWAQDMRAAKETGMIPLGIARSLNTHEVLTRNGAVYVVDHLSELAGIIRKEGSP